MPRSIEMLTYPTHITFIRRGWGAQTDIKVSITDQRHGQKKVCLFPDSQQTLRVDGLNDQSTYRIKLEGQTLLSRLTRRSRVFPQTRLDVVPHILIIGSGRCGTTSIASYLDGLEFMNGKPVRTRHETLFEHMLPFIIKGNEKEVIAFFNGFWHDIESAPHLTPFAGKLQAQKVLHIIRDGRRVIQSGLNRGWYQKDDIWERIKPDFDGTIFQKCCYFWEYMVSQAEQHATKIVRLEDIANSRQALDNLVHYLDIKPTTKNLPVSNTGKVSSDFKNWSTEERDQFEEICGRLMNKYYPGWKEDFS